MFIAWYWIVLIALVVVGYFLHLKRYCRAFRQDRDALLEALLVQWVGLLGRR